MKGETKIDYKRWHLQVNEKVLSGPPYSNDLLVTPESRFKDNCWLEPVENLPTGGQNGRCYDFLGFCLTKNLGRQVLRPGQKTLLRQLKEVMIGVKHHRHALNPNYQRPRVLKPRTWRGDLREFRRIFIGAMLVGVDDIRKLDQPDIEKIRELLHIQRKGLTTFGIHVDQILHLARAGLISGNTKMPRLEVAHDAQVIDTTIAVGTQALSDEQIQRTIEVSLFYVDNVKEIASAISALKRGLLSERWVREWCSRRLPCKSSFKSSPLEGQLISLVQVAAANLIGYHLGTRPSETLSMKNGCVTSSEQGAALDVSRMEIAFQTFKAIQKIGGLKRIVGVSNYIRSVVDAVEVVMNAAGAISDNLFSDPRKTHEYNDNQWNAKFVRFCKLHDFSFRYSGTSWRKSLISIQLSVFENPIAEVATIANHLSGNTTAGYAQSPFILNEFNEGYMQIVRARYRTMFESSIALGGAGIGGLQGLEIEKRLPDLFKTDVTEHDIQMTMDEFIDDLLSQGILPVLVKPGVLCVKGPRSPGYCSQASGDTEPDPSRCSPRCHFQVQLEQARVNLVWEIEHLAETMKSQTLPALRLDFWLNDILDRVNAWPSLRPVLSEIVAANEELASWFGNKLNDVKFKKA